ncbi:alcohol dehydrogenase-like regulatory protein ErcA [Geobacter sulfurreducens]|uniref:alcohol dehydrogenase-like regulatory protein ErcA n=1 Tax=Geobacter sulfurreducens TaxID=35554 RepID=UPI002BADC5F1|nr:alcohol dehydrogenase-like regulatory protein ErcA [Geobacter sulfurreducens]HML79658.1 iron-containing alcohol dehydrogenase [Geobacter sulfurreducens]
MRRFVCPEIVHGVGARNMVGQYAVLFDLQRVLVVSDPGVINAGWTGQVIASLESVGIEVVLYSDVSPNPRDNEVAAGAALYTAERCDALVAVGGGSPLDCAKGIGVVSSNHCAIEECAGVNRVTVPMPPLFCVPTTSGSAAELSQFAIITDTARRLKMAIVSKALVPDVAFIDPFTTISMDPYLTACTGMDALVHGIEAYVSSAGSRLTDLHALEAVRLVAANLRHAVREPESLEARTNMMLGSLQAGLAFSNASLGAVHAMSHSVGGTFDLPHGECNAMLLEPVVAYNFPEVPERYRVIGEAMGLRFAGLAKDTWLEVLRDGICSLRHDVGIDATLGVRGIRNEDIPSLAAHALCDACMVTNPRRPDQNDIERIYAEAL